MSFESPSGAPAPEDAPPLTPPYQGAPPFQGVPGTQGTPQYAAAPYPQYAGYQAAPPAPRPSSAVPTGIMALSGLYIVLCLVAMFVLNHRVSLWNKFMNDPTSVTLGQLKSADNAVNTLGVLALIVFLALLVLLIVWQRSLRNSLAPTGQYQQVLKESGYQIFRIVWLVSIVLAIVLRGNGSRDSPQAVVSHDHEYMFYYGLRAVVAGLLIFFALRLKRTSDNAFSAALSQAGYGAGAPAYPQR